MSQITIIGLGLVGSSIGLALKALGQNYTIVGHDKNRKAMDRAGKAGAIDTSHWNLIAACENADMIIAAIPLSGIAATFEAIRQDLKPGCLILDTAPLKRPVQKAASEFLPDNVHFIGSDPVLVHRNHLDVEDASATLFKDSTWALCPSESVSPDAVKVVTNMINAIGATPYFLSAEEHDGLVAAADSLPTLLAGALMHAASSHDSWQEIRRMAGVQFERNTQLPDFDAESLAEAVFDNRDNVQYWVEAMIAELEGWRKALDEEDAQTLVKWFEKAQDERRHWLKLRETNDWDDTLRENKLEYTGFMKRMLGGGAFSRKRDKLWKD